MQTIASSTQRVATPTAGARGVCAPLRPTIAIGVQQQQQQQHKQQQAQHRSAIVLQAVASASDIREIENMVVDQAAAAGGSTGMLPSGNVKLRVRMRGYDIAILAKACEQIKLVAGLTGARIAGPVMLPTKKRVYCVLRSPHVNKDAREHFEIRIHNRLIDVTNLSSQTVQALMEWVPPSGLEVETSIV